MNGNLYVKRFGRKFICALREYPLQMFGAGFVSFIFLFIITVGLFLPHRAHGQALQNFAANQPTQSNPSSESDAHQPLAARFLRRRG